VDVDFVVTVRTFCILAVERNCRGNNIIRCLLLQRLEFGAGDIMSYDFESIEACLRDALMPSAHLIALAVREFAFKGEQFKISRASAMTELKKKVKQEHLPSDILDQVCHC
jgi:hypothetical protein